MRQLGARAGVQSSTVHRIEAGRISPTVAMLGKLAKALDIRIVDFFPTEPKRKRRAKR